MKTSFYSPAINNSHDIIRLFSSFQSLTIIDKSFEDTCLNSYRGVVETYVFNFW